MRRSHTEPRKHVASAYTRLSAHDSKVPLLFRSAENTYLTSHRNFLGNVTILKLLKINDVPIFIIKMCLFLFSGFYNKNRHIFNLINETFADFLVVTFIRIFWIFVIAVHRRRIGSAW